MENNTAILIHQKTRMIYRHIKGDTYRNVATGVEGEVAADIANKVFKISVPLSMFCNKNKNIETLISKLGLRAETPEQNG